MRDKDWQHIVCAFWLAVWLVASPVLLVISGSLLDPRLGEKEALFPCPWLLMGFGNLGAALLLLAPLRFDPSAPTILGDGAADAQKSALLRVGGLAVLQALETGLGNVAQTGLSVAARSACDSATPAIALAAGVYLGTERHAWRSLAAVSACAILGGLLALRGVFEVTDGTDLAIALGTRMVSVAKWMFAKALLESMDPLIPWPATLAQRSITAAAVLGFELTGLLQRGCFGSIFSLKDPMRVWSSIGCMSLCTSIWMLAELKALRLSTPTLLGFLHPFRCFVPLAAAGNVSMAQAAGLVLCSLAGVGYAYVRCVEARELAEQAMSDTPQYLATPMVTKILLAAGDGKHYPSRGSQVHVRYVGSLAASGAVFDQGALDFRVGKNEVIEGWDVGVMQMSLGERAVLEIPSGYAYGRQGHQGLIPANADLVFRVHIQAIDGQRSSRHACLQM